MTTPVTSVCLVGAIFLLASLLLAALAPPVAVAPVVSSVSGVVFEDLDGNHQRDPGEPGIGGALISDQVGVAGTDEDGTYRLLLSADSPGLVFVVPPPGFRRPGPNAGADEEPSWFRHIVELPASDGLDDPSGSAAADEGGGGQSSSRRWDIALVRWRVQQPFRFAHLSDPHVDVLSAARLQAALAEAAGLGASFAVISGDLVRDALRVDEFTARQRFERYASVVNAASLPVFSVPGNHDIFGIERDQSGVSEDHPLYGKQMYRRYLGPNYYAVNIGPLHLLVLDSVVFEDLSYRGEMDSTQLRWLQQDLAAAPSGSLLLPVMHIPLVSAAMGLFGYQPQGPSRTAQMVRGHYQFRHLVANAPTLLQLFRRYPVSLVLGGHFHKHERIQFSDGGNNIRFENAPAVVGEDEVRGLSFPSGFLLFEVEGDAISEGRFVAVDGG
ncbi:MAG: metallophosphoesterase family protein [Acidobacteriota bacterium]